MVHLTTYMVATTAMIMGISALDHASVQQVKQALKASNILPSASASASASASIHAMPSSIEKDIHADGILEEINAFLNNLLHPGLALSSDINLDDIFNIDTPSPIDPIGAVASVVDAAVNVAGSIADSVANGVGAIVAPILSPVAGVVDAAGSIVDSAASGAGSIASSVGAAASHIIEPIVPPVIADAVGHAGSGAGAIASDAGSVVHHVVDSVVSPTTGGNKGVVAGPLKRRAIYDMDGEYAELIDEPSLSNVYSAHDDPFPISDISSASESASAIASASISASAAPSASISAKPVLRARSAAIHSAHASHLASASSAHAVPSLARFADVPQISEAAFGQPEDNNPIGDFIASIIISNIKDEISASLSAHAGGVKDLGSFFDQFRPKPTPGLGGIAGISAIGGAHSSASVSGSGSSVSASASPSISASASITASPSVKVSASPSVSASVSAGNKKVLPFLPVLSDLSL